jgi:hypothetical protein
VLWNGWSSVHELKQMVRLHERCFDVDRWATCVIWSGWIDHMYDDLKWIRVPLFELDQGVAYFKFICWTTLMSAKEWTLTGPHGPRSCHVPSACHPSLPPVVALILLLFLHSRFMLVLSEGKSWMWGEGGGKRSTGSSTTHVHNVACLLKARIVKPAETAVDTERLRKRPC